MNALPQHVNYALDMLLFGDPDEARQELADRFAMTWGGFEEAAYARAINQGNGIDQVLAILALGDLATSSAREYLLPVLASQHPVARWASAFELGKMREERSLPVLFAMLTEFLPPNPEYTTTWLYWGWRPLVPQILGAWGQRSATAPLREALRAAKQVELAVIAGDYVPNRASEPEDWARYQEEIVYALGRIGAWGALTGTQEIESTLLWWRVHLIMGYLHGRYRITSILLWKDHPALREEVERLLEHTFGLDKQERNEALDQYQTEKSFEIWSRYNQEQQEKEQKED